MKQKSRAPAKRKDRYLNKLTQEQKVFVVKRLATYDTPTAIVRDLKALFGVEVTPQAIDHYLPHKAAQKRLAPYWQELFRETRKTFIAACAEAGTMEQMVRVHLREDMVLKARDAGHYRIANELLDSIAKEAGKMFTSRQVLTLSAAPALGRAGPHLAPSEIRGTTIFQNADGTIHEVRPGTPGGPLLVIRCTGEAEPELPENAQD